MRRPVKGKLKGDLTPLFGNARVLRLLVNDLSKHFVEKKFDKVACIDAMGFVLGAGVALKLGKGLVVVRKQGRLPLRKKDLLRKRFVDYTNCRRCFELSKFSVKKGERFLLVDDWIETGAQVKTAMELIHKAGGVVVGVSCIGLEKNKKTLFLKDYDLFSVTKVRKKLY